MKYGNVKMVFQDRQFDSKKEARRYQELVILQGAGKISGLVCQVPYVLAPSVKLHGDKRTRPALRYVADFVYSCPVDGIVVEDVKSIATARLSTFRLKQHLMKTVLGIDIRVIK